MKYFALVIILTLTSCGTFIEEWTDRYIYGEPRDITFINHSDYEILIRGYGVRKTLESRYNFNPFDGSYTPGELTIQTGGKYRRATDYKFTYDQTKVKIQTWNSFNMIEVDHSRITFINIEDDINTNFSYSFSGFDSMIEEDHYYSNEHNEINDEEYYEYSAYNEVEQNINEYSTNNNLSVNNNQIQNIELIEEQNIIYEEYRSPLPLINNFQRGMFYLQIGSYSNINNVYKEIERIDQNLPVSVMQATVIINNMEKEVYRVLIGPLNYSESRILLQQFRVNYKDAFIWTGR